MDEFRVVSSGLLNHQFQELYERARSERIGLFALEIATALMEQLRVDPLSMGEEAYELKQMKLQVRHVVRLPWSIYYGVDASRRIVYLKSFALMF